MLTMMMITTVRHLVEKQTKADRDYDTFKDTVSIPIRSTVAIEFQDGVPWAHGTIADTGNHRHNDRSYNM